MSNLLEKFEKFKKGIICVVITLIGTSIISVYGFLGDYDSANKINDIKAEKLVGKFEFALENILDGSEYESTSNYPKGFTYILDEIISEINKIPIIDFRIRNLINLNNKKYDKFYDEFYDIGTRKFIRIMEKKLLFGGVFARLDSNDYYNLEFEDISTEDNIITIKNPKVTTHEGETEDLPSFKLQVTRRGLDKYKICDIIAENYIYDGMFE